MTRIYRRYYKGAIGELAQCYPNEQRSLEVDWRDIYKSDPDVADDYLTAPEQMQRYFEEAFRMFDPSIDINLLAHVRVGNLEEYTFYLGEFSRSEQLGNYRSIRDEITKATSAPSRGRSSRTFPLLLRSKCAIR
ncbi:hypothetical protein [Natrinema salinisoli]|uniref:hypothetical protein n=1 Tax=Natrinema salinisoli TaxID=2878535 RepID=UPI001CEFC4EC|nr:hypothetical protein [Natrinema salinisoli]